MSASATFFKSNAFLAYFGIKFCLKKCVQMTAKCVDVLAFLAYFGINYCLKKYVLNDCEVCECASKTCGHH